MSEILVQSLCTICLNRIRWFQDWVGIKRYNCAHGVPGPWVERAHYKCWKKEQEDGRAGASQMAVPRVDDQFTLRDTEPRA